MVTADWYFDFVSPFAYLQHARFDRLPAELTVTYRPVLFAGLLRHWGQLGPAEVPAKRLFTYRYVTWLAAEEGIPFAMPAAHPFNPLPYLRLALALGCERAAMNAIFRFIWTTGKAVHEPDAFAALAQQVGVADPARATGTEAVKSALRANGAAAIAAGVFGVPTFVVDGQLFFGQDATGMLLDHLQHPGLFKTAAMRRLESLPVAAERR